MHTTPPATSKGRLRLINPRKSRCETPQFFHDVLFDDSTSSSQSFGDEFSSSHHSNGSRNMGRNFSNHSYAHDERPDSRKRRPVPRLPSDESMLRSLAMAGERDEKLQIIRDSFSSRSHHRGRPRNGRRTSLSSEYSSQAGGSQRSLLSFSEPTVSKPRSGSAATASENSPEQADDHATALLSFNMSSNTIPVANIVKSDRDRRRKHDIKTEQLVESLVWFSFHTPRTVLEDLISHELELWRSERTHVKSSNYMRDRKEGSDHDGSLSSLSEEGAARSTVDGNFSEAVMRLQGAANGNNNMIKLPKSVERESALLFVDMSGFTKLSTILDVESLSKVINSYFDMIVNEVIQHGGDILKFAGDAFFAEWKVVEDDDTSDSDADNPLADLNASLASISEIVWDDDDDIPKLSTCVLSATKCAAAIVRKYSDYQVTLASTNTSEAMLNVHCGIGVGHLVGLHVGDYNEDQEEEAIELRREFLILGEAIDQVAKAADMASDGQVVASPEAMLSLAFCCELDERIRLTEVPVCVAERDSIFVALEIPISETVADASPTALQPYESLRMHCKSLNHTALARLHLQMALYVHPVIRSDELALSAAIQAGKISQPTETLESRHRAEAELRSVFTIFIKAIITPRLTGLPEVDQELYKTLGSIMHVTSRELDRYSGHLRQFIVDDKGVVLIATFGLRGSTFPNMVANNGLPACFAIHRALKTELRVENRIGATFGKAYCGVVGGVRRHEFAVMGAPVNLAARLMSSKENKGILVDEAVQTQVGARYAFTSLPPVRAKGYDKPVPVLEPNQAVASKKKKKSSYPFVGRKFEKQTIASVANKIIEDTRDRSQSSMIFLMGESGMGKSALAMAATEDIKKEVNECKLKTIVTARSTSSETEQRIPLSSFRKIFLSMIHDYCDREGALSSNDEGSSLTSSKGSISEMSLRSLASFPKNGRLLSTRRLGSSTSVHGITGRRNSLSKGMMPRMESDTNSERSSIMESLSSSMSLSHRSSSLHPDSRHSKKNVENGYLPMSLSQSLHGLSQSVHIPNKKKGSGSGSGESLSQSLHRLNVVAEKGSSSHRRNARQTARLPGKMQSIRGAKTRTPSNRTGQMDDSSVCSPDMMKQVSSVPYFEKLCWLCEEVNYPHEYADIVGSQFLGLESASPVTHVDGHVPTMDELVDFLSRAFIRIADSVDLTVVFLDDFQWVDTFSWKIFRELCQRAKKLLLICATRSHDKQALRRMSTAATRQTQSHSQMMEISLGPLDFSEIQELMAEVLGYTKQNIPEVLCADIFQRTGGLPVYVIQILDDIKRKKTLELVHGELRWNAEGLKEKRASNSSKNGAVMEETFLSRFDALDLRLRKVLQTCAVLGFSFALSDVIQVHPEMEEIDIENALDLAVDEMILVEQIEEDHPDDEGTVRSGTSGESDADSTSQLLTVDRSRGSSDGHKTLGDRFFQFSHAMWRKNVLTTMLHERKVELHHLIAESMEQDQCMDLEDTDISRLLTLFDHWKACGDFRKSAPLALAVGSRLEEWDLSAQSLEIYEDALEMAFDNVQPTEDDDSPDKEWIEVKARPLVLDLILRLHIRIGLCHQRLGDDSESFLYFEDAFTIIKSSSKIPGMSKLLMMPIISSLCVLKIDQIAQDGRARQEQERLVCIFVEEASKLGDPLHLTRALAMQAGLQASDGKLSEAVSTARQIQAAYSTETDSQRMISEYGRDFALEKISECSQWLYLLDEHDRAARQADLVIERHLPAFDPLDINDIMHVVLPLIMVLKLLGRARDADWLLKKYVINPYHDRNSHSDLWTPLFNPLAYLLAVVIMEDSESFNYEMLNEIEKWAVNVETNDYDLEIERKAHTLIGELCWRLANFKEEKDQARATLIELSHQLLTPVAKYPHGEIFLKYTAEALLDAM